MPAALLILLCVTRPCCAACQAALYNGYPRTCRAEPCATSHQRSSSRGLRSSEVVLCGRACMCSATVGGAGLVTAVASGHAGWVGGG
jgi:hypothetical protein